MRENSFGEVLIGDDNMKSSNPFPIEAHVLGKGLSHEHVETLLKEVSDRPDVFFKASTGKALIG